MTGPIRIVRVLECPELSFAPWDVFTSLEGENSGGSIKDRMVLGELDDALRTGRLSKGVTVAEISAGSTALSLARACAVRELKCVLFVPDQLPANQENELKEAGAELRRVPSDDATAAYRMYETYCRDSPVYPLNQMFDQSKRRHYHRFGAAISRAIGRIDAVIGAVGTGHSLVGTGEGISPAPLLVSAEPDGFEVAGVRNLDRVHFGPRDPCFDQERLQREILHPRDLPLLELVRSSEGDLHFSESFRLVLGALLRIRKSDSSSRKLTVFLLGAANRRQSRP